MLRSEIPRDLELLERDGAALRLLFSELELHADRVEELVEMDPAHANPSLLQQVHLGRFPSKTFHTTEISVAKV